MKSPLVFRLILIIVVGSGIFLPTTRTHSQFPVTSGSATDVAWNPDGSILAISGDFGVAFYDADFQLTHVIINEPIRLIDWSPDGKLLATNGFSGEESIITVWDMETSQPIMSVSRPIDDRGFFLDLKWSPDSQQLAVLTHSAVTVYDVASHEVIFSQEGLIGYFNDMAWSPDGTRLAAVEGAYNTAAVLYVWAVETDVLDFSIDLHETEHFFDLHRVAWNPDGTEIALGVGLSQKGAAPIWDIETQTILVDHVEPIEPVTFMGWSPDGTKFALADEGGAESVLFVWNENTGARLWYKHNANFDDDYVTGDWKPDSSQLAMVTNTEIFLNYSWYISGTVIIVDAETGEQVAVPELPIPVSDEPVEVLENPTPRQAAEQKAALGVLANSDWQPFMETFDGVEMVLVPAGCFEMGNDPQVSTAYWGTHCTYEPFWIDRFEVTRAEYARFIDAGGYEQHEFWTDEGWEWQHDSRPNTTLNDRFSFLTPAHPVYVSWYEASAYAAWRDCRLPIEEEWEYAARGPDNLFFPWGNDFMADNVVYGLNPPNENSAPVGSKPEGASWVAAMDMSGNVWEWTGSIWRESPRTFDSGPDYDSPIYTTRGGGFFSNEVQLRSAFRTADGPTSGGYYGFRIVCDQPPS